mmetsp:Transcript_6869/g.41889  ORF Transcript_6869/g.41889 Transcript_6869/m.41889 type:complete len:248 (+) Transcript_6869:455-1198(+)
MARTHGKRTSRLRAWKRKAVYSRFHQGKEEIASGREESLATRENQSQANREGKEQRIRLGNHQRTAGRIRRIRRRYLGPPTHQEERSPSCGPACCRLWFELHAFRRGKEERTYASTHQQDIATHREKPGTPEGATWYPEGGAFVRQQSSIHHQADIHSRGKQDSPCRSRSLPVSHVRCVACPSLWPEKVAQEGCIDVLAGGTTLQVLCIHRHGGGGTSGGDVPRGTRGQHIHILYAPRHQRARLRQF